MKLEIEAASRRRVVEITGAEGRYQAIVDGRSWDVDAARAGQSWSLLVRPAAAFGNGTAGETAVHHDAWARGEYDDPRRVAGRVGRSVRSFEVTVVTLEPGHLVAYVGGKAIPVRLPGLDRRRWAGSGGRHAGPGAETASGSYRVVAPMPGRIVKLLVKPGDAVTPRQGVVVVEAMKMENELRAARAGTVTEVRVAPGASVEANTVLVVIE